MWHPKFDPHENPFVEDIPEAPLSLQPSHMVAHKSQTVDDYLKSAPHQNNQSLTQKAVRAASQERLTRSSKKQRNSPTKSND